MTEELEKELKWLFDEEQQLGINEQDRFHNSKEGKKRYESVFQDNAGSPIECFKKGAEFMDKRWQEKTRWRSLLTTPPKLPSNPSEERQVLIKHAKGGYDVKFLVKQSSIDYWLKEGFVFWKEIE